MIEVVLPNKATLTVEASCGMITPDGFMGNFGEPCLDLTLMLGNNNPVFLRSNEDPAKWEWQGYVDYPGTLASINLVRKGDDTLEEDFLRFEPFAGSPAPSPTKTETIEEYDASRPTSPEETSRYQVTAGLDSVYVEATSVEEAIVLAGMAIPGAVYGTVTKL